MRLIYNSTYSVSKSGTTNWWFRQFAFGSTPAADISHSINAVALLAPQKSRLLWRQSSLFRQLSQLIAVLEGLASLAARALSEF
jgi:hypothetical protein